MKLIKNRLFLAVVCVVISAVCVFGFLGSNKSEDITAYKITQNVSQGTQITDEMIEKVTIGSKGIENVVSAENEIVGKFASSDLTQGQMILENCVAETQSELLNGLEKITNGKLAYSISVKSLASSVSDKILSGDVVTAFVNVNGESMQPLEIKYIEVLNATTSTGLEKTETSEESISTITLIVDENQAKLLNDYEYSGQIHLALVHRGDEKIKQEYLAKQVEITEELKNPIENLPFVEGEDDGEVVLLND